MKGLQTEPVHCTSAVMPLVLQLVQHLGGARTAAKSATVGARVFEARMEKFTLDLLKRHVDKLRMVRHAPGGLYWHLGFDNYAIWALDNSGSSYTLVSQVCAASLGCPLGLGGQSAATA